MKLSMVTLDCRDAAALSGWWARLLSGTSHPDVPGFWIVRAPGVPVRLGFQEVPDPTPGKNKMHLDLDFGSVAEAVDHAHSNVHADFSAGESSERALQRLTDLGAARVGSYEEDGFRWWVFADPEGNQFCVSRADEKAEMADSADAQAAAGANSETAAAASTEPPA